MTLPLASTDAPEEQFNRAKKLLEKLLRVPEIRDFFETHEKSNTRLVYTQSVTIWLLILQRLCGGASLSKVVSEAVNHQSDLFPDNRRVREGRLGENTSSFSNARKRLPLEAIEKFSRLVCDYLAHASKPVFNDRRVFILDGTTITLPPTPELRKAFPPASNQHGESVWPIASLMVAAEMQSGCVLIPKIDPMYGSKNSSEAKQSIEIVRELPEGSVVLADSGFGIFCVSYHTQEAGHDFLFRLTMQRFKSHRKNAELIDSGEGHKSYRLSWTPSAKERKTSPDLPADANLQVYIHEVLLENGKTLALISNMEFDALCLAELYRRRYDIEFDIRDVKVTMDTENIRAKSTEMVRKELLGSIVAYNLVVQFRRSAARLIHVPPRRLSFSGVWLTFKDHLLRSKCETYEQWQITFSKALLSASKRKLPNRKAPREYPRVAHTRRQKSTKFQKALIKKKSKSDPPPPE